MDAINESTLMSRAAPNAPKGISVLNKSVHESMHFPPAWVSLSVGHLDDAYSLSSKNNDVLCLAASLVMRGDTERALKMMEALIISSCVVVHERLKGLLSDDCSSLKRMSQVLLSHVRGRAALAAALGASIDPTSEECQQAAMGACEIVDWDVIHRWFIIALLLHDGDYKASDIVWFHHFFALPPMTTLDGSPKSAASARKRDADTLSAGFLGEGPTAMWAPMDASQMKDILLSHCGKDEVLLISTICAWKTRRYRSVTTSATEFLALAGGDQVILDDYMSIMVRFVLCMSLIELGERTLAGKEVAILMQHKEPFVAMVGCSIATFLLPLPECIGRITSFNGPIPRRRYLIALCEYIHALTLLQLGSMEAAIRVIREALPYSSSHNVGEWLLDILCIACTAIEDSKTISEWPVSVHRQLYLALAPAFFGGFNMHELKVNMKSPLGRMVYPRRTALCASIKQMLPVYMVRANQKFAKGEYVEAWENVTLAVACAEEIIGSVEFAFTDCSPMLVYAFGCRVGEHVIGELMSSSTSEEFSTCSVAGDTAALVQKSDMLGESVIQLCLQWARRIREFHPNARLGALTMSKCTTFAHTDNFLSRAMDVAHRYPGSALAQNCLTLALYGNHNIPEAADSAANALQTFPHTVEVKALYGYMLKKDGLYYYNYRGLIPIHCSPCNDYKWAKRNITTLILLLINVVVILVTLSLNLPNVFSLSETAREIAVRVQLPTLIPISYTLVVFTYAITASFTKNNLTHTILQDLFFDNGPLNRFVFAMRGIAFVNASNALLITIAGNNFLFTSHWYTFLFYLVLFIVFVPFTSHLWLLPSSDQPREAMWTWLALVSIDVAATAFLLVPHVILFVIEPLMFALFFLQGSTYRPTQDNVSGNVKKRLVIHTAYRNVMPSRYAVTTGSGFIHLSLLKLLFYKTHSSLSTKYLIRAQTDEENYRVFPLIEVFEPISPAPIELDEGTKYMLKSYLHYPGAATTKVERKDGTAEGGQQGLESDSSEEEGYDDPDWGDQAPLTRSFAGGNTGGESPAVGEVIDQEALNSFLNVGVTVLSEFGKRQGKRKSNHDMPDNPVELSDIRSQRRDSVPGGERRSRRPSAVFRQGFSSPRDGCGDGRPNRSKSERRASFAFGDSCAASPRGADKHNRGTNDDENRYLGGDCSVAGSGGASAAQTKYSSGNTTSTFRDPVVASSSSIGSSKCTSVATGDAKGGNLAEKPSALPKSKDKRDKKSKGNASDAPPEELQLKKSLEQLCEVCRSVSFTSLSVSDKKNLEGAKTNVHQSLSSLCKGVEVGPIRLKSEGCCEAVCDALFHLIAEGDVTNPLEGVRGPLAETLLQRVELSCLANLLVAKEIPLQCVLHGRTNILNIVMVPSCVEGMCADRWSTILTALQTDARRERVESLRLLFKGLKYVKGKDCLQSIKPMLQTAVTAVLIAESAHVAGEKLFALLETIKKEGRIPIDFWEEEDSRNRTLFSHACASGNVELVDALWCTGFVKCPNKVQGDGTNGLMQAVINNQRRVVQWFCDHAMDSTDKSFQHVHPVYGDALNIAKEVDADLHALIEAKVEELKTYQWASTTQKR